MGWKKYLSEYDMGLGKNTHLFKQVVLATVDYIQKMDLPEDEKQKLITYVKDDVYVRRMNPQSISEYVKEIMQKLGM